MGYETGFQATSEDLMIAMATAGRDVGMDEADALFDRHVRPRIEEVGKAALGGHDLDEQTEFAQAQITRILVEVGELPDAVPAP